MNSRFSQMSTPPPSGLPPGYGAPPPGYGAPPPGYGAPPPGYGAPPPKKNNTATIVLIVLGVVFGGGIFVVAILAAILFPVFQKVRGNARLASCEANVRQIDLGLMQYQQDHNDKFPPSAAAYKDAIYPYVKSDLIFHCPADQAGTIDYALNAKLQGRSIDNLAHPEEIVTVYEGHNQILDFRHDGRAVVGFADGHDRALTEAQAQHLKWQP
ncbi:MAG: DUF1559 domain-containing protein [Janthinobacterium lividum]